MGQSPSDKRKIGFIGLGMMGASMARCLMNAGYPLTLLANKSRQRIEPLLRDGAAEATTPAALAAVSDVIVTCVPEATAVTELADQLMPALGPDKFWIDTTTSDPSVSAEVATRVKATGAAFADAPVTGGPPQAERGELASLVGCAVEDFSAVEAVVGNYSKVVRRFGDVGAGHTAKLLNNLVSQGTMILLAEAFGAARHLGVDWAALYDVMMAGAARSGTLEKAVGPALSGDFDGSRFTIANAEKDLRYVSKLFAGGAAPGADIANALHDRLAGHVASGHGQRFVSRMLDADSSGF
ncbi:MAG: NAD(P)-dependent oxidoreductase [Paracoccaceae bacterium]|nr:NAD(P)-dependent oxidoreductase [Paracoccaceae bacterium]